MVCVQENLIWELNWTLAAYYQGRLFQFNIQCSLEIWAQTWKKHLLRFTLLSKLFCHCSLSLRCPLPHRPQLSFYNVPVGTGASLGGPDGKESICNAGDVGSIPGSGRSPGEGNDHPLQYSCLRNSMDRGAWWAAAHGVTKDQTPLRTHTYTHELHEYIFFCLLF